MSDAYVWSVIAGMAVANLLLRFVPIAFLSRVTLPGWMRRWLTYIPVSVMAALVVGEVMRPDGSWLVPWQNPYLWASVATGLIYWRFRSFLGATVAGIILFLAFRAVLG